MVRCFYFIVFTLQLHNHLGADGSPEDGPSKAQPYKQWVPWPLRAWFYIPLILTMAAGGIVLEVMLHVTDKRNGGYFIWYHKAWSNSCRLIYQFFFD
jgi:hypothetical protein